MSTEAKGFQMTAVQREVLTALDQGGMLVQDRQNTLHVAGLTLQPRTREILMKNKLIERLDKARGPGVKGNGFVITAKGRALLTSNE